MEYLALYRKYRPSDLKNVVGQSEIKKILANSIINNTITHAYLFSGPRGTGKTTMAKILAKMVNCESPVDGNPCGKCNSCLNLLNSSDIIEIDAASNNGVDEIRDLREKANLVPSICKYKVYIIDEVHMLTVQAFNALLKTLEEPPKHVIFILATTEYHRIPLTISSRCQKFQFNKIDVTDIVSRLKEIAQLEKIDIDDDALLEIAKISDGGMRDSINFLDQIRSFTTDRIVIDDVFDICGNISLEEIFNLFVKMKNNDFEGVTLFFEQMNLNGKNYNKFFEDVICFLKDVILYKKGVALNLITSNYDVVNKMSSLYSDIDLFYLINSIDKLMEKLKYISRQSVIVIANFVMMIDKLNKNVKNMECKKSLQNESNLFNEKYDLAFNISSSDEADVIDNETVDKISSDMEENEIKLDKNLFYDKNKNIIINNAFAVADKKIKIDLQCCFNNLNEFLMDKKFSTVAGVLMDTNIEVAGEGYIILTGNYDAVVRNVYTNYKLCSDLINDICKKEYLFAVITIDEWNKYREEYINRIKNGKKYEIMNLENVINTSIEIKNEATIVDKLFDIVGDDVIEFR